MASKTAVTGRAVRLLAVVLTGAPALAGASALVGCATSATERVGTEITPAGAGTAGEVDLGRVMLDMDRRVDRYVYLASQAGEDARAERALLGPALKAQVAQYQAEIVRFAADRTDPARRRIALKALGFSDDPGDVVVLAAALEDRGDVVALTNATYAIGRLHSPATPAESLVGLVKHPDADVRSNALLALWKVFDAKRAVGASPLDPVTQESALPLLEAAMFDPDDAIQRGNAAAALGAMGDRRAVDSLLNLLRDEHPYVRTQTALALGKLGDLKAIPALVKLIDETPQGTPRGAVIAALSLLLERSGRAVPDNLGDSERAWEDFVRERLGPPGEPFEPGKR